MGDCGISATDAVVIVIDLYDGGGGTPRFFFWVEEVGAHWSDMVAVIDWSYACSTVCACLEFSLAAMVLIVLGRNERERERQSVIWLAGCMFGKALTAVPHWQTLTRFSSPRDILANQIRHQCDLIAYEGGLHSLAAVSHTIRKGLRGTRWLTWEEVLRRNSMVLWFR